MKSLDSILEQIIKERRPCFFFSPHLDDGVLSCGNLIGYLSGKTNVTVVTVFTKASEKPYSFSARRFLMHCNETNASVLFQKRRYEDKAATKKLGAACEHLGCVDGTWRRHKRISAFRKRISKWLPEVLYQYPTFVHIMLGVITKEDKAFIKELQVSLRKHVPSNAVIFAPLAVGGHVDHVVIREVFSGFDGTIFWSDFPYNLKSVGKKSFISRKKLKKQTFITRNKKESAIRLYTSQLPSLFPDGKVPQKNEVYFVPSTYQL
jgi:LmbE family N-acetylglucosaminyl deacetylase